MTDPIDAFVAWFDALKDGQQVDLAVHLAASLTPVGQQPNLGLPGKASVLQFLRTPAPSPIQTITRLGVLRALVDLLCVPLVRQDLQAHGQAQLAIMKVRALAAGQESSAELAQRASAQGETFVDDNAHMYTTWDDLAHAQGGALTPEKLYEWLFLTTRNLKPEASPFVGKGDDVA